MQRSIFKKNYQYVLNIILASSMTVGGNFFTQPVHADQNDDVFVKLGMFEQLCWAFGDNFYPNLHQNYRVELAEVKMSREISDIEKLSLL